MVAEKTAWPILAMRIDVLPRLVQFICQNALRLPGSSLTRHRGFCERAGKRCYSASPSENRVPETPGFLFGA